MPKRSILREAVERVAPFLPQSLRQSIRRVELGARSFRVGLERPVAFETTADFIEVRGWAVSLEGLPTEGIVVVNDTLRLKLEFNELRLDVARAFALSPRAATVGFRRIIPWSEVPQYPEQAEIRLEMSHGQELMVLGPITVYPAREAARQRFFFNLERPAGEEIIAGDMEVRGWMFSLDDEPMSGRIIVDDNIEIPIAIEHCRSDVNFKYELGEEILTGFEHKIRWRDLGRGVSQVRVQVELVHGRDLFSFGPFLVSRTSQPLLRHQRGSYKEVWESAASDPVSAMATVAGTSEAHEFFESGASTARTIGEALDIGQADTVLEIGCGVGRVGYFLSPQCGMWIGTDISSKMLAYAGENLAGMSNVQLVELDGCELSQFAECSIDKVYCSTVFMHLDEWDRYRYVREAFRVLRPGGLCYFDNVNLAGEIGWEIFEEMASIDAANRSPAVTKPSTAEELKTYLTMAGFEVLSLRPGPHYVAAIGRKL